MNRFLTVVAAGMFAVLTVSDARAELWPQWRGATGHGISNETDLPVSWSADKGELVFFPLKEEICVQYSS